MRHSSQGRKRARISHAPTLHSKGGPILSSSYWQSTIITWNTSTTSNDPCRSSCKDIHQQRPLEALSRPVHHVSIDVQCTRTSNPHVPLDSTNQLFNKHVSHSIGATPSACTHPPSTHECQVCPRKSSEPEPRKTSCVPRSRSPEGH